MNVRSSTSNCLDACAATPLFRIESQVYTWREVLAFAELRGTLATVWERTRAGIAATRFAEQDDLPLTPEDLEQAAEQLRYRLQLVTADDTLNWLKARDLTLDDFEAYVWRHLNREHVSDYLDDVLESCPVEPAEIAAQLWSEVLFGADYRAFVLPLAEHALVRDLSLVPAESIAQRRPAMEDAVRKRFGLSAGDSLDALPGCHFLPHDLTDLLELSAAYAAYQDTVASPDKCRARLRAQRSRYVEIEFEHASFAARDVASEAHMCVTLDGESLSTVASRAMCAYESARTSLAELPDGLASVLLSAEPGEYLDPFEYAGDTGIHIARVIRKQSPSLDDPGVLERLRRRLTQEALEPYLEYRVQWLSCQP